jgi:sec-independent protein translocase protein TatC
MPSLKWLIAIAINCLLTGMLTAETLTKILLNQLPSGIKLVAMNPFDGFMLTMNVGLAVSLFIAMIFLVAWFWFNYKDAFTQKEKSTFLRSIAPSLFLFIFGVLFGGFIYFNSMLPFFAETNTALGLENLWSPTQTITNGITLALMLGIAFQLPLLIRGLIKLNFVQKSLFTQARGQIFFIVCLIAAVITPTPDLLSMGAVAAPLYGLFELGVLLG